MDNFLTKPEEIDRYCALPSGGEEEATREDFDFMEKVVKRNGSKLVLVVDAEGEHICIAPEKVAEYIAKLINEDTKEEDKIYSGINPFFPGTPVKFNSKDYGVLRIEAKKE